MAIKPINRKKLEEKYGEDTIGRNAFKYYDVTDEQLKEMSPDVSTFVEYQRGLARKIAESDPDLFAPEVIGKPISTANTTQPVSKTNSDGTPKYEPIITDGGGDSGGGYYKSSPKVGGVSYAPTKINYDEVNRFREDMIKKGEKPETVDIFIGNKLGEIQKRDQEMQDYQTKLQMSKDISGEASSVKLSEVPSEKTTTSTTLTTPPISTLENIPQTTGTDTPENIKLKYNYKLASESGDLNTMDKINAQFKASNGYGINEAKPVTKKEEDAIKVIQLKEKVANQAEAILNLIDQHERGLVDSKTYNDTLNSLASDLVLTKKEADNLGAALSGNELAILSGQVPVVQPMGRSLISTVEQAFTGKVPVQRGQVNEPDINTLKNKMKILASGMRGEKIDATTLSKTEEGTPLKEDYNLIQAALNDSKDIVNGILGLPKTTLDYIQAEAQKGHFVTPMDLVTKGLWEFGKGSVLEANQLLGEPLKGGDIAGRAWERIKNKPVTTLLDILAIKGGISSLKKPGISKTLKELPKEPTSLQKSAARGIVNIDPRDIVRSEAVAKDVAQMTKSISNTGIARELKAKVGQLAKEVDDFSNQADSAVGQMSHQAVLDRIMSAVNETDVAKTNPKLVTLIKRELNTQLNSGVITTEGAISDVVSTKPSAINKTRRLFNSEISDNWFANRKQLVTDTDKLSSLRWKASEAMRDILGELDQSGQLKESLRLQSSAIEAYPQMSLKANGANITGQGGFSFKVNALKKATQTPSIIINRAIVGKPSPLTSNTIAGAPINPESLTNPYPPAKALPNISSNVIPENLTPSELPPIPITGNPVSFPKRPAPELILKKLKSAIKSGVDVKPMYTELSRFYKLPKLELLKKKK